jgi:hypothetical protein
MRKGRYNIHPTFWTCRHCGFIHRPADLQRLDFDNLQCRQCNGFAAKISGSDRRSGETCFSGRTLCLGMPPSTSHTLRKRNDINAQRQRSVLLMLLML